MRPFLLSCALCLSSACSSSGCELRPRACAGFVLHGAGASSPFLYFWFPEAKRPEETREVGTGAEEQAGGRIGEQLCASLGRAALGTALCSSLLELRGLLQTPRCQGLGCQEQSPSSALVCLQSTASSPSAAGAAHGDASSAEEESGCLASSPPQRLQDRAEEGVGDLEGIEVRVGSLVLGQPCTVTAVCLSP